MNSLKSIYQEKIQRVIASKTNCANCWGYQEWNGSKTKVAVQPQEYSDSFIIKFVKKHLSK